MTKKQHEVMIDKLKWFIENKLYLEILYRHNNKQGIWANGKLFTP